MVIQLTFVIKNKVHACDVEEMETAKIIAQAIANHYDIKVSIWDINSNRTIIQNTKNK